MAIVEVKNLSKSYGEIKAVNKVSFKVKEREIFGFLGPNGAGKTTTLEMIEGLRSPDSGAIMVKGTPVWPNPTPIKSFIGVQLQTTAFYEELTVLETVKLFASFYDKRLGKEGAFSLLESVGLTEKAKSLVGGLSGGQRQRLALAVALVNDPEILFLDEPTTGLDPQARRHLWKIVEELNAQGKTIVLTTHYMEEAETLCARVAVIDYGKIVALDTPQNLIKQLGAESKITFRTNQPLTLEKLNSLPAVSSASAIAEGYALYTQHPQKTIVGLMEEAKQKGLAITDLHASGARLEDVFLHLTGRELRE